MASVTVDGVARVFRLKVDFARSGPPTAPVLDQSPYLELKLADPPTPGRSVAFRVGADRAPPDATLDVRLLRPGTSGLPVVEHEKKFPRPLDQTATIAVGDKPGELLVTATVADWSAAWDLPQIIGSRTLEARLLTADGKVLLTQTIKVVLDDTPPTGVAFRSPPAMAKAGDPLLLRATAADPESGIAEVSFFAGKLTDGKPPSTAVYVPAIQSPNDPTTWTATVPTMSTDKGPTDFSVKAVNGAGLPVYASASVNLVDKLPTKPGAIAGQLVLGSTPQAGLTVSLLDANGKALKTATTDTNGKFTFDGLKAGAYKLAASKVTPPRAATATVQVRDGATTPVELSLYLTSNTGS